MLLALPARIPGQMPLVPLYDENAPPGSSHRVRAPGGYETWRIISYDARQDLLLFAAIYEGCLADPDYTKAYRRYIRRPTRTTPPLPQNYAAEEYALYHHGQCILSGFTRLPPQPVSVEPGNTLRIGQATLSLEPIGAPLSLQETTLNPSHQWSISSPLAHLRGRIDRFEIDALAVRDHRIGTAPLNVPMWIDGVAFFSSSAMFFQATSTTSWIIQATGESLKLVDQPLALDAIPSLPVRARRPYPQTISLGERFTLTDGGLVDMDRMHILYQAKAGGELGRAFCQISYPKRLRWPLIDPSSPRPNRGVPQLTVPSAPPTDKSSPSAPERARDPSSSP